MTTPSSTPDPESILTDPVHLALRAEVLEMRQAVAAMRDTLEQSQRSHEAAVQSVLARCHQEETQLRQTLSALRDALESARVERDQALQAARLEARQEADALRATASALRDALEAQRQHAEQQRQASLRDLSDENRQLRATIAAIRSQWTDASASHDLKAPGPSSDIVDPSAAKPRRAVRSKGVRRQE